MRVVFAVWGTMLVVAAVGAWLVVPARAELLLHWTFDEQSGPVLDQGVAPAADGALFGGATRTANTPGPKSLQVLDLVGTNNAENNYAFADYPEKLNAGLGQMTVSFWINMQDDPAHLDRVASMWSTSPNVGWEIRINNPDAGSLSADNFNLRFFTNSFASKPPDIVDHSSEWLFLAVTYDSALEDNNSVFYMGTDDDQTTLLGTWTPSQHPALAPAASGTEFRVGSAFASSSDRTPPAWIDDLRVYDEVLGLAQLEQVRLAVLTDSPPTLAGDFNNDGIVDAADYTVWRDTMGDAESYNFWKANFGNTFSNGGVAAAVPEPAGSLLAAIALLGLGWNRSHCRGNRR